MSQNMMPFLGKSGTPLMELATSCFLSSSNMVSALCCCCPDTENARLDRPNAAGLLCGGRWRDVLLAAGKRQGDALRFTNMRRELGCAGALSKMTTSKGSMVVVRFHL